MTQLTFWYDFASSYSYLSALRIESLCGESGIKHVWRPFLLGAIFQSQGWNTSPFNIYEAKGAYMIRDIARVAQNRELPPFRLPSEFPQKSLLAARIGTLGANSEWIADYTKSVLARQFVDGLEVEEPETHVHLLNALGQPGKAIVSRAATDTDNKLKLRRNTELAQEMGLFGAPSFVTDDAEVFWGDDRLEGAIDWALKHA
ncbi:MAG: 2-hydroxychromene-2-carboxylate isomerase [Pseudomonadota bacterium]